jgi:hypothetical protein
MTLTLLSLVLSKHGPCADQSRSSDASPKIPQIRSTQRRQDVSNRESQFVFDCEGR